MRAFWSFFVEMLKNSFFSRKMLIHVDIDRQTFICYNGKE